MARLSSHVINKYDMVCRSSRISQLLLTPLSFPRFHAGIGGVALPAPEARVRLAAPVRRGRRCVLPPSRSRPKLAATWAASSPPARCPPCSTAAQSTAIRGNFFKNRTEKGLALADTPGFSGGRGRPVSVERLQKSIPLFPCSVRLLVLYSMVRVQPFSMGLSNVSVLFVQRF